MAEIVEIEFRGGKREEYHNPMEFPFQVGDHVLVEVEKGEHIARVCNLGAREKDKDPGEILYRVLRKAGPEDLNKMKEIHQHEREAMKICRQKVENHGLPM